MEDLISEEKRYWISLVNDSMINDTMFDQKYVNETMNTKTLTKSAQDTINQYQNFKVGPAVCSVPYFNNKTVRARAALRSLSGKGSPKEILEEIQSIMVKNHVDTNTLTSEPLKKVLTDSNIGIDCSAFAYYILNSESLELKKTTLNKSLHFPNAYGLFGKLICKLRPATNCDVANFAHNKNSKVVPLKEISAGDIITMIGGPDVNDRNHILIIDGVDYENDSVNNSPIKISYVHSIAYPEDGVYGTGIKRGSIEVIDSNKNITEQIWSEKNLLERARKSQTELRRLNFLC